VLAPAGLRETIAGDREQVLLEPPRADPLEEVAQVEPLAVQVAQATRAVGMRAAAAMQVVAVTKDMADSGLGTQ